jgi:hypothetical protein
MALQKTIQLNSGITVNDAIHYIDRVSIINGKILDFRVRAYVSYDKPHVQEMDFETTYDESAGSALSQAYNYLMTLAEYQGATEVADMPQVVEEQSEDGE